MRKKLSVASGQYPVNKEVLRTWIYKASQKVKFWGVAGNYCGFRIIGFARGKKVSKEQGGS